LLPEILGGLLSVLNQELGVPDVAPVEVVLGRALTLAFVLLECGIALSLIFNPGPAFLLCLERLCFEFSLGLCNRLASPSLEIAFLAVDLILLVPEVLVVGEALGL
jgi:hypothetical protein